ncbi:MAG: hypothetical protein K2N30_04925 [Clostridia bacterium]|nr:hypothetical protein [Clostridia bacterium]
MKIKKTLLAVILLSGAVCAGAFAISGCADGNNGGTTEIPDEQTPLAPVSCEHKNISHENAVPATCTENGNSEYWYCGDCKKYFSDAEYKNETSLAAVTVTAGHDYGKLIDKVPATTCVNGTKAHYHCNGCNTDFDENKQEFLLPPFGDITIYAQHNLTLVPASPATCEEDGVTEAYRHCSECGKDFDEIALREIEPVIEAAGHTYPDEFTYDYAQKLYKKVCGRDASHVKTQEAGVEGYPYRANDLETLRDLLSNAGGHVILEADVSVIDNPGFYDITVNSNNPIVLDLNGHTVTGNVWGTFLIGTSNPAPVLTVKNGNVTCNGTAAFYTAAKSVLTLENVNITSSGYGIYATCGTFNVIGGEINAANSAMQVYSQKYYSDPNSKPVSRDDYDLVINISDAKIKGTGIGLNLRSAYATLENTELDTANTCILAYRDSNVTINDCTIKSKNNCGVQGNGTKLITDTSNKQYYNIGIDTVFELNNCTIEAVVGIYHPQIDGKLTVNGGSIKATQTAVEVRAGDVELNNVKLTSTAAEFSAEANKSGSTAQGVALTVSQHTTDDNIVVTVNGCELNGIYAIFEKDLMDDNQPKDIIINIADDAENTINGLVYSENCGNIVNTADDAGNAL